ncbi:MAG: hypothetical protein IPQ25_09660 [Chitinophagaceae bacterium]|nr:hypothetical protein [Chitinophagaceae bacterium]
MAHTWVGDLVMNLKAPNGQTLNLIGLLDGGTGSNGTDDFVNTVVDSISTTAMSGAPAPRTGSFRADRFTDYGSDSWGRQRPNSWSQLLATDEWEQNWTLAIVPFCRRCGDVNVVVNFYYLGSKWYMHRW